MVDENVADATEEWRPVVGYEGLYAVSSIGRIRNLLTGNYLSTHGPNPRTYPQVSLKKGRKSNTKWVHRLVARAFLGEPAPGIQVNHVNGIRNDNRVGNLEYVTGLQNTRHAIETGLANPRYYAHKKSRLTSTQAEEIRALSAMYTRRDLARVYETSVWSVHKIVRGVTFNS